MKSILDNFLDEDGLVIQWPAKHSNKQLILEYLAQKFSMETSYSEKEINEILKQWHTFGDWAILRRSLVDYGYMQRKAGGTEYHRLH